MKQWIFSSKTALSTHVALLILLKLGCMAILFIDSSLLHALPTDG